MTDAVRQEWPHEQYLSAWKTFRRLSNENRATARHLVNHPRWPAHENIVLSDVGCGDGALAEEIVLQNRTRIHELRLVDPDEALLHEAEATLTATMLPPNVTSILGTADEHFPECASGADAVLLVHVVYLMRNGTFRRLLERLPVNVPVFVLLDAPHSIFTTLWRTTAVKYHERALAAHQTIAELPRDRYTVDESTFQSLIPDPFTLRPELRTALLSMLCYAAPATIATCTEDISAILARHRDGVMIGCTVTCYSIIRHTTAAPS